MSPGEGTFYGPKIDFHITDALGRSWQCGTCQVDFQMPERFDLTYQGEDNAEHRPVMIHRALLGSMERFAGILIEHYAGRFPAWLAPVQAAILPVADRHTDDARDVATRPRRRGRPGPRRRALRVGGAQDPRRRAAQASLHARRRRQGAGGRRARRPLARRGRPRCDEPPTALAGLTSSLAIARLPLYSRADGGHRDHAAPLERPCPSPYASSLLFEIAG